MQFAEVNEACSSLSKSLDPGAPREGRVLSVCGRELEARALLEDVSVLTPSGT